MHATASFHFLLFYAVWLDPVHHAGVGVGDGERGRPCRRADGRVRSEHEVDLGDAKACHPLPSASVHCERLENCFNTCIVIQVQI